MNPAKKYRKKPVVITASQWNQNGDHPLDDVWRPFEDTGKIPVQPREGAIVRYFRRPDVEGSEPCQKCNRTMHEHGWIDTLEGGHIVCPSDFIITGIKGELYPCKSDIFEATYEAVEQELKRPTINELEKILQRTDLKVALNPDGSLTTVKIEQPQTSLDCVGTDGCKASTPVIKPK